MLNVAASGEVAILAVYAGLGKPVLAYAAAAIAWACSKSKIIGLGCIQSPFWRVVPLAAY
jgi:hypothetical protein